ncbi:hypothetical protein JNE33_06325 [Streptococcus suis]|uniref:pyruvate kinase n=1 Tax=Streptococcus suis TaxID=1307 RepID=UPI00192DCDF7|nr:pyruvate kinase [Streptococcus suis]MBL6440123.1 hypothetical protein [Streptococcus suis]
MDIMLTIQPWNNKDLALQRVKLLKKLNIKKVRVNLKTLYKDEHFNDLFLFVREVNKIDSSLEWYFDIGIPADTLRVIVQNSQYHFVINKNEKILFSFDEGDKYNEQSDYNHEKVVYIRKSKLSYSVDPVFVRDEYFLYGDGEVEFKICNVYDNGFEAKALNAGEIWDGKAIHIINPTPVQYESIDYVMKYIDGVTKLEKKYLICSFVEEAEQVFKVKEKTHMDVISKIETTKGILNLKEIASESNGIMLGRGDLFMDTRNLTQFWELQQVFLEFIENNLDISSIIATDIFESLTNNKIPTRSDITDFCYISMFSPGTICLSSSIFFSDNFEEIINTIQEK